MIRTTRVYLLGKNYSNFPIFTQRAPSLSKLALVEFKPFSEKPELATDEERKKNVLSPKKYPRDRLVQAFGEIKYVYLRDLFQGGYPERKLFDSSKRRVLHDFINNLPTFQPPEIIQVMKSLLKVRARPVKSLRTLCGVISAQDRWEYTIQECSDLLYCLAKLSFRDEEVIKLISQRLLQFDDFNTSKEAGMILFNLSDLKYRDCDLLEKLFKYVMATSGESIKPLLHCLRAAALLNYSSPTVDEIIQGLAKLHPSDFNHSTDYLNFVWMCVILQKGNLLSVDHISETLSDDFVKRIVSSGMTSSAKYKLLNINAVAAQMPLYDGSFLSKQKFDGMILETPKQGNKFFESTLDALLYAVKKPALLTPQVNTKAGFYLDFQYTPDESKTKARKTGIVLVNFNDICSDGTLTGPTEFKKVILEGMGYRVVFLRYSDYDDTIRLSEKGDMLLNKLLNQDNSDSRNFAKNIFQAVPKQKTAAPQQS